MSRVQKKREYYNKLKTKYGAYTDIFKNFGVESSSEALVFAEENDFDDHGFIEGDNTDVDPEFIPGGVTEDMVPESDMDMDTDMAEDRTEELNEYADEVPDNELVDNSEWSPETINATTDTPIMELVATFNNRYVKNIETIHNGNAEILDLTGDIKTNGLFAKLEVLADLISVTFKDDKYVVNYNKFKELLCDKKVSNLIKGTKESPFIYEGLQLIYYMATVNLTGLIPYCISRDKSLEDMINELQLKSTDSILDAICDILSMSNKLGKDIYFMEPEKNEVSGKDERLSATPYAKSEVFTGTRDAMTSATLSNESVINMITIKNNKAIEEYALILKACTFASDLCADLKLDTYIDNITKNIKMALSANTDAEEKFEEAIEKFREDIFMKQNEIMAKLTNEELNNVL